MHLHKVTVILCLYLGVSGVVNTTEEVVEEVYGGMVGLVLYSMGMLLLASCLSWHLLHMTSGVERLRRRFGRRGDGLVEVEVEGGRELRRVAKQVGRVEHLTALGFFPICRGTLQAMAATAATYLIILVQFKSGVPVTPK